MDTSRAASAAGCPKRAGGGSAPAARSKPADQQPAPAASKPPVAPSALASPRAVVAPPKFSDRGLLVGGNSAARHNPLSRQTLGAVPPNSALLDSPVLLPVFTVSTAAPLATAATR